MNVLEVLVWGGIATVSMTTVLETAMAMGWTRMSLPYILGTIVTSNRRTAPLIGMGLNFVVGILFAFGYALAFESLGRADGWIGAALGAVHTAAILVILPFAAGFHPRMATEQDGPGARTALQPPGFFALYYGRRTPLFWLLSHLLYGLILGAFYHLP
ncbi:MAG: hypothetical protein PVI57_18340 [Gemmatimonadota bacterium]|jgi:hypothetical protein